MVLKQYKKYNTGNTVRAKPSRGKNDFSIKTTKPSWRSEELDEDCSEEFQPGISYSTDKRGRWHLKDRWMQELSSGRMADDEHLIVVEERDSVCRRRGNCHQFVSNRPGLEFDRVRSFMNGESLMGEARLKPAPIETDDQEDSKYNSPCSKRSKQRRNRNRQTKVPIEHVTTVTFSAFNPDTLAIGNTDGYNRKYNKPSGKRERGRHVDIPDCIESFYFDEEESVKDLENQMYQEALTASLEDQETFTEDRHRSCYAIVPKLKQKQRKMSRKERKKRLSQSDPDCNDQDKKSWICLETTMSEDDTMEIELQASMDLSDSFEMVPKNIYLNRKDILPSNLETLFPGSYEESRSCPRHFLIDLSMQLVASWKYEGPHLNRLATLIVRENSQSTAECEDLVPCTVELNLCLLVSEKSDLPSLTVGEEYKMEGLIKLVLQDAVKTNMKSFDMKSLDDSTLSRICIPSLSEYMPSSPSRAIGPSTSSKEVQVFSDSSWVTFCGNCLEPLADSEVAMESSIYGLSLHKCGHNFCSNCWRQHLVTAIRTGSTKLQCPEPNCEVIVDTVTCLSFVSLQLYTQHESQIDNCLHSCPNQRCNHLIRIDLSSQIFESLEEGGPLTLKCVCNTTFCSQCRQPGHAPSSCEAARHYNSQLQKMGHFSLSLKESGLTIKGKTCPRCKKFIEKQGGRNVLTCCCGYRFCWYCKKQLSRYDNCFRFKHNQRQTQQIECFTSEDEESKRLEHLNKTKSGQLLALALAMRMLRREAGNKTNTDRIIKNLSSTLEKDSGVAKKVLDSKSCFAITEEYQVLQQAVESIMKKLEELRRVLEYIYVDAWHQFGERELCSRLHNQANRLHQLHDRIVLLIEQSQMQPTTDYTSRPKNCCDAILQAFTDAQAIIQRITAINRDKHSSGAQPDLVT